MTRLITFVLFSVLIAIHSIDSRPSGQRKLVRRPAEIVLVLDFSYSIEADDKKRMIATIRTLPDSIGMGEEEARMAVVVFSNFPEVVQELTADERKIRVLSYKSGSQHVSGETHTSDAFVEVKNVVLRDARPDAAKVVLLFTDGEPTIDFETEFHRKKYHRKDILPRFDFEKTEVAARDLRDTGVSIYVATIGDLLPNATEHLIAVAGDSHRVFDWTRLAGLVDALNKDLETIEYECDQDNGTGVRPGAFIGGMVLGISLTVLIGGIVLFIMKKRGLGVNSNGAVDYSAQIKLSDKENTLD